MRKTPKEKFFDKDAIIEEAEETMQSPTVVIEEERDPELRLIQNQSVMMPMLHHDISYNQDSRTVMSPVSSQSKNKISPYQIRRQDSDISMISEIVKKKRITFLKSS